jgi:hypothetical protein
MRDRRWRPLLAMDGYERRTRSRRKSALRAVDEGGPPRSGAGSNYAAPPQPGGFCEPGALAHAGGGAISLQAFDQMTCPARCDVGAPVGDRVSTAERFQIGTN